LNSTECGPPRLNSPPDAENNSGSSSELQRRRNPSVGVRDLRRKGTIAMRRFRRFEVIGDIHNWRVIESMGMAEEARAPE
jgi:hypothetical protein